MGCEDEYFWFRFSSRDIAAVFAGLKDDALIELLFKVCDVAQKKKDVFLSVSEAGQAIRVKMLQQHESIKAQIAKMFSEGTICNVIR